MYKNISVLLISVLALFSCSGGADDGEGLVSTEYLNVTSQITISGDGNQTGSLDIKADCAWTISGNPSWMTLSANSGNGNATVTIKCTPNPSSTDERSAVLTVSSESGKVKKTVTVSQPTAAEYITLNVSQLEFTANAESKVFSITSNASWNIIGAEDWFSLSKSEGSGNSDITVTAKNNDFESSRQATLTVQSTHSSALVTIKQEGIIRTLSVSPENISATAVGAEYSLKITGDATWVAKTSETWCSLSKYNGVGDDNIVISVEDNTQMAQRSLIITFETSIGAKTCTITQAAAQLPSVDNVVISNIDKYSFGVSSAYSSEYPVLEYGICYSDDVESPSIDNECVKETGNNNNGTMSFTLSNLISGHKYYLRAYAKSVVGIAYSEVATVTTLGGKPENDENVRPQM